jgi:hypothetical protein
MCDRGARYKLEHPVEGADDKLITDFEILLAVKIVSLLDFNTIDYNCSKRTSYSSKIQGIYSTASRRPKVLQRLERTQETKGIPQTLCARNAAENRTGKETRA